MSEHKHEEIEVYPDSGITETGKPIFGFLWVTYVLLLVFFHFYVSAQFWKQDPDLPFFGPGWNIERYDRANVELDWQNSEVPHGAPSSLILGKNENYRPQVDVYDSFYGARR